MHVPRHSVGLIDGGFPARFFGGCLLVSAVLPILSAQCCCFDNMTLYDDEGNYIGPQLEDERKREEAQNAMIQKQEKKKKKVCFAADIAGRMSCKAKRISTSAEGR